MKELNYSKVVQTILRNYIESIASQPILVSSNL
jgi:hypothetical protein